jgi:hypothetical protein
VSEIQPAALLIARRRPRRRTSICKALLKTMETRGGPFMPVLARVDWTDMIAIPFALPVAASEPASGWSPASSPRCGCAASMPR